MMGKANKSKSLTLTLRADAADNLTLGDMETLEKFGQKGTKVSVKEVISLLGKVLVEDPRTIPLSHLREAIDLILEAIESAFSEDEVKN